MNEKFLSNFNLEDRKELSSYFNKLINKIKLSKKETKSFIEDFERAILYYSKTKSINEILEILSLDNLGDIYITSVAKNEDGSDMYMVQGVFKRAGNTELTVETPEGEKIVYNLEVKRNTYNIERKGE